MSEPTACDRARPCLDQFHCNRCDLLVGLDGLHVLDVIERDGRVRVVVEPAPELPGRRVILTFRSRREVTTGRRNWAWGRWLHVRSMVRVRRHVPMWRQLCLLWVVPARCPPVAGEGPASHQPPGTSDGFGQHVGLGLEPEVGVQIARRDEEAADVGHQLRGDRVVVVTECVVQAGALARRG